MCQKRSTKEIWIYEKKNEYSSRLFRRKTRVDACMTNLIAVLNMHGIRTLACCCGHGRYDMTIVHRLPNGEIEELLSGRIIPRAKRFYVRDSEGYFYIQETVGDGK